MFKIALMLAFSSAVFSAPIPSDVSSSAAKFQQAVAAHDIEALASIAHFPIKSNMYPPIKNAQDLKKLFPQILPKERIGGLVGQSPADILKDTFTVSSADQEDPIQFIFKKFGKHYLWYYVDNINE